uniref:Uncharacterized protein n=1 Tax=Chromera velia CCMP2878 TaxID=1169474 RepID=A0A0G4GPD4_9ALVE|eukprot:Cvel_22793.t1-p1 / transcript=Cvel_22793.t1 / gene=Cvel_22793 / organism=Chromera_velia_CCMP2878 / gene_product=hypothetical protein / transcript_product=hypothetical protein / location=Cvel_scaffold2280:10425-14868(+) / protein_length=1371 / sequence_SO=supercontig / SO=protein_coding / is_pseudo=false
MWPGDRKISSVEIYNIFGDQTETFKTRGKDKSNQRRASQLSLPSVPINKDGGGAGDHAGRTDGARRSSAGPVPFRSPDAVLGESGGSSLQLHKSTGPPSGHPPRRKNAPGREAAQSNDSNSKSVSGLSLSYVDGPTETQQPVPQNNITVTACPSPPNADPPRSGHTGSRRASVVSQPPIPTSLPPRQAAQRRSSAPDWAKENEREREKERERQGRRMSQPTYDPSGANRIRPPPMMPRRSSASPPQQPPSDPPQLIPSPSVSQAHSHSQNPVQTPGATATAAAARRSSHTGPVSLTGHLIHINRSRSSSSPPLALSNAFSTLPPGSAVGQVAGERKKYREGPSGRSGSLAVPLPGHPPAPPSLLPPPAAITTFSGRGGGDVPPGLPISQALSLDPPLHPQLSSNAPAAGYPSPSIPAGGGGLHEEGEPTVKRAGSIWRRGQTGDSTNAHAPLHGAQSSIPPYFTPHASTLPSGPPEAAASVTAPPREEAGSPPSPPFQIPIPIAMPVSVPEGGQHRASLGGEGGRRGSQVAETLENWRRMEAAGMGMLDGSQNQQGDLINRLLVRLLHLDEKMRVLEGKQKERDKERQRETLTDENRGRETVASSRRENRRGRRSSGSTTEEELRVQNEKEEEGRGRQKPRETRQSREDTRILPEAGQWDSETVNLERKNKAPLPFPSPEVHNAASSFPMQSSALVCSSSDGVTEVKIQSDLKDLLSRIQDRLETLNPSSKKTGKGDTEGHRLLNVLLVNLGGSCNHVAVAGTTKQPQQRLQTKVADIPSQTHNSSHARRGSIDKQRAPIQAEETTAKEERRPSRHSQPRNSIGAETEKGPREVSLAANRRQSCNPGEMDRGGGGIRVPSQRRASMPAQVGEENRQRGHGPDWRAAKEADGGGPGGLFGGPLTQQPSPSPSPDPSGKPKRKGRGAVSEDMKGTSPVLKVVGKGAGKEEAVPLRLPLESVHQRAQNQYNNIHKGSPPQIRGKEIVRIVGGLPVPLQSGVNIQTPAEGFLLVGGQGSPIRTTEGGGRLHRGGINIVSPSPAPVSFTLNPPFPIQQQQPLQPNIQPLGMIPPTLSPDGLNPFPLNQLAPLQPILQPLPLQPVSPPMQQLGPVIHQQQQPPFVGFPSPPPFNIVPLSIGTPQISPLPSPIPSRTPSPPHPAMLTHSPPHPFPQPLRPAPIMTGVSVGNSPPRGGPPLARPPSPFPFGPPNRPPGAPMPLQPPGSPGPQFSSPPRLAKRPAPPGTPPFVQPVPPMAGIGSRPPHPAPPHPPPPSRLSPVQNQHPPPPVLGPLQRPPLPVPQSPPRLPSPPPMPPLTSSPPCRLLPTHPAPVSHQPVPLFAPLQLTTPTPSPPMPMHAGARVYDQSFSHPFRLLPPS